MGTGIAVQLDHRAVDTALIESRHACQGRSYDLVHVGHGLEYALAAVTRGVIVTQFQSLVFARRGARRNRRAAACARFEHYIHLHRGVATRVKYLAGGDPFDSHIRHIFMRASIRRPAVMPELPCANFVLNTITCNPQLPCMPRSGIITFRDCAGTYFRITLRHEFTRAVFRSPHAAEPQKIANFGTVHRH